MATLALSVAGQFVGGALGGPFGAMAGRALGALAGSAIDNALFGEKTQSRLGADIRLQGSSEGGPVPRQYGWGRIAGNIIWATELERLDSGGSGAKAMGSSQEDEDIVVANFAIGLCEGEVHRLGRIWADGQVLDMEKLTYRFYRGTQDQSPDGLIAAKQGIASTPAYRGLCYIVFERLPLTEFGNRIPNISVEVCRVIGDLEPAIRAITVIPGATEFGYDPVPRVRLLGPGETTAENTHLAADVSDWTCSIDELQQLCPGLEHVALVVTWFGTDLRCGSCTIEPRVEDHARVIEGAEWSVAGLTSGAANPVSRYNDAPAYGGTPSDAAVIAAIADLKARGLKVTLYPLVMMDVPAENDLTDPYTGAASQPPYPWRGRITCSPAPGQPGTPDGTGAVTAQVDAFWSGIWGYRRMVLHYAGLALTAGGIDAFLIGSELRGLTTLRSGAESFPVVDRLVSLAGEARAILGPTTRLTYAADWSEYFGYQPATAPADRYFHLDPLWASPDIDAVGIDNYMPLSDWRDGDRHLDFAGAGSIYSRDYLASNIAGGEGYDWFYGSDAERLDQERSPITDGTYGEPWIYRYKDLRNWWDQLHYNRIAGVRATTPTAWTPRSKPFWLTELGCGAVDKGANAPNVFGDAKSTEDARPPFSTGTPDALIQRQFLRAHFDYWRQGGTYFAEDNNPVSPVYGGRMLDAGRIYVWTWDARPYPAFPTDTDTWADGANHSTGHWLTGRLGGFASDELIGTIARDYGVTLSTIEAAAPYIHGLTVEATASAREALEAALSATGLSVRADERGVAFVRAGGGNPVVLDPDDLAADGETLLERKRPDPSELVTELHVGFFDRERDYQSGTVTATRHRQGAVTTAQSGLVLDAQSARLAAERMLLDEPSIRPTLEFSLPPSRLALELGDAVEMAGQGVFEVTELRDGDVLEVTARARVAVDVSSIAPIRQQAMRTTTVIRAIPIGVLAHIPGTADTPLQSRLIVGAYGKPWPGEVTLADAVTGATALRLGRAASIGTLATELLAGDGALWDRRSVDIALWSGHIASRDEPSVLAGANRIAVETGPDVWEVIGFATAELIGEGRYRLTDLLRGQNGTLAPGAGPGARVVVLDGRVGSLDVPDSWLGRSAVFQLYAGPKDLVGQVLETAVSLAAVAPLAPAHLTMVRQASGDIAMSWLRRSRMDADAWGLAYAPLEYESENYLLRIEAAGTLKREVTLSEPAFTYANAEQNADFGGPASGFEVTVQQVSARYGAGQTTRKSFDG